MKQVRRSVFETNSSSTHSLTIVSVEEWEAFERGEMVLHRWHDKLITLEEFENAKLSDRFDKYGYQTYEQWCDEGNLETFEQRATTKSGDEIVAFGKYGYDG